ncbi:MAG: hypothetical protein HUU55_01170 [Myxococcales bacterium]|nr:hypothetical protein [Myxococcales bacterium]
MSLDKMMTNRRQWSDHLVAAGKSHAPALAEKLAAESLACGINPPDGLDAVILWLAGLLQYRTGAMVAAETALNQEAVDDVPYREARDGAAVELYTLLSGVRTAASLQSNALAEKWMVKMPVPETASLLYTYGKNVSGALSSDAQTYKLIGGLTFIPQEAAQALKSPLDTLGQALDDLAREGHEWNAALNLRDLTIADWARSYSGLGHIFEGLFLLVNEPLLADRARPTIRKRRGEEIAPPLPTTQADAATVTPTEPTTVTPSEPA